MGFSASDGSEKYTNNFQSATKNKIKKLTKPMDLNFTCEMVP